MLNLVQHLTGEPLQQWESIGKWSMKTQESPQKQLCFTLFAMDFQLFWPKNTFYI
jgi:hypothetical protein